MKSIGKDLINARTDKGIDLKKASDDTRISRQYLELLEREDFDSFPGETYLIGFLRNYSEYLGLSGDDIVTRYQNLKLQEQPAPIDELLGRPTVNISRIILIIAVITAIAAFGFGGYWLYTSIIAPALERPQPLSRGSEYRLDEAILERQFIQGDTIRVPIDDLYWTLQLAEIGQAVQFLTDNDVIRLQHRQSGLVDVNGDGTNDIRILIRTIDSDALPPTVVARFDKVVGAPEEAVEFAEVATVDTPTSGVPGQANLAPINLAPIGSTNVAARVRSPRELGEYRGTDPFRLVIDILSDTLIHYRLDNSDLHEEFYDAGSRIELNIAKEIQLRIANAGAVEVTVNGRGTPLGEPGEVVTTLITAVVDPQTGRRMLWLLPVY